MAKTKVVLNLTGFYALRTSSGMQQLLALEANKVRSRAGDNFSTSVRAGGKTATAHVYANGAAGMREERKHGTLSKAVAGWGK